MISIQSVAHQYNRSPPITFKDWEIKDGEQWLLLGESGSGKTTLLHVLTGILKPTQGEVNINDTSIYNLSSKKLDQFRGRNIGIIFQKPHLIKSLTIFENLALAQTVEIAHSGLMKSKGHRENILNSKFNRVGIGIMDGGIYGF